MATALKPLTEGTTLYDFTADRLYLPPDNAIDAAKKEAERVASQTLDDNLNYIAQ